MNIPISVDYDGAKSIRLWLSGQNPVAGDDVTVSVTITNMPGSTTLTKAWLTFKQQRGEADPGILQEVLTSGFSASGTTVTFSFDLSKVDTALFTADRKYVFDLQIKDSNSKIKTPVPDGSVIFQAGVTAASS